MKTKLPDMSMLNGVPHDYLDSYTAALNASGITIEQVGKAVADLIGDENWHGIIMPFRLGYPTAEALLSPRRGLDVVIG